MNDQSRKNEELIEEIAALKRQIGELDRSGSASKRADEALRPSESCLMAMLQSIPDHMSVIDKDLNIIWANEAALQGFGGDSRNNQAGYDSIGRSQKEAEGKKCFQLINRTKPCQICITSEVFRTKKPARVEKYSEEMGVWLDCRAYPVFDEQGNISKVIEHLRDITEQKKADEELRICMETVVNSSDAVGMSTPEGKHYFQNQAFDELFGLVGENPPETVYVDPAVGREVLRTIMAGGRWTGEVQMYAKDRRILDIHLRAYANKDVSGRITALVGILTDITDRKKAEKELLQFKKSESLERMAKSVAHHYNNLMGAVLGNLELAAEPDTVTAEVEQRIATARSAANRAADISRFMLTYLGQSEGTRKPLYLAAACSEALHAIAPRLSAKVRLETNFPPAPGLVVRADSAQLKQALDALLTNAIEAVGETGGAITVTVDELPAPDLHSGHMAPSDWRPTAGRYARLAVADTGPGMVPESLEKVFDPFFSTKFTGRGLGLPVVQGIVKAHGGAVFVASRPGAGATVRLLLPISDELPPETSAGSVIVATAPLAGHGLVLAVDDEPFLQQVAHDMLQSLGFEVIIAPSGAEAVEIFRQRPQEIRCVLTDLTMPGMNGWETLAALRRIRTDIPVILCSGYDEASAMADARTDLPQAFLGKPYGRKLLSKALAKALG